MSNSQFEHKTLQELAKYAIDALKDGVQGNGCYASDLHSKLFNEDYFIIGYYQAEQWLIANTGIFNAMEIIKDYEQDNFGEVLTDLSDSEKVCNMIAYIGGEEVLQQSKTLQDRWNDRLSDEDIECIIEELKEEYSL